MTVASISLHLIRSLTSSTYKRTLARARGISPFTGDNEPSNAWGSLFVAHIVAMICAYSTRQKKRAYDIEYGVDAMQ